MTRNCFCSQKHVSPSCY